MATTYGQIQEFCSGNDSIEAYLERIELYFTANNIVAERQVAVFLSVIGGKNYTVLRNLLSPAKPSGKTLAELTAALKKHFALKRLVIAVRFRFYRREQAIGESRRLRGRAATPGRSLQFRRVLGRSAPGQASLRTEERGNAEKHLLSKLDLTLLPALEIAQSQEAAERNSQGSTAQGQSTEEVRTRWTTENQA